MGQPEQRPPDEVLDPDLAGMVRAAGRAPIGGAAAVSSGAAAIIGIDWKYNGQPTVLALVAASAIAIFVALALAAIGLRLRRDTAAYAREQQQQRLEREQLLAENTALKARVLELEARLAERPRRRNTGSLTRGRAVTPIEVSP